MSESLGDNKITVKGINDGSAGMISSKVNNGQCQHKNSVTEGAIIRNNVVVDNDESDVDLPRRKSKKFRLVFDILKDPASELRIDKTVLGLIEEVEKRARPVKGRDDIRDGVLSIESSSSFETTADVEEGMKKLCKVHGEIEAELRDEANVDDPYGVAVLVDSAISTREGKKNPRVLQKLRFTQEEDLVKTSLTGVPISKDFPGTEKMWTTFLAFGDDTLRSTPAENKQMKKATTTGIMASAVFHMLCGVLGYAAFANDAPRNFLTGFGFYDPFWLIDVANFCIVIHLPGAYQHIPRYEDPALMENETQWRSNIHKVSIHVICRLDFGGHICIWRYYPHGSVKTGKTDDSIPLIFLITHGTVEDERDICNMVKDHAVNGKLNSPRICTFGIGNREKRGAAPAVKLIVKWAPYVYEPIPTSVSHVGINNRSSRHSKKNSRNKQKSRKKSSRGSKGKDKKYVRKHGGNSSNIGYMFPEHEKQMVDFRGHKPKLKPGGIDLHVGNPGRFYGSNVLKRYGTSLHLSSVTDATYASSVGSSKLLYYLCVTT
ncbi:amino acid permease 6-like protein, partial [Tanacetum coccineum]